MGTTAEFEDWVQRLKTNLLAYKADLDTLEAASLDGLGGFGVAGVSRTIHESTAQLAVIVRGVPEEVQKVWRDHCFLELAPIFAYSPFMRRAGEKPLGYAGDYEMMNMLYRDHAEGDTLFGRALNLYATSEPAAEANINRVDLLSTRIRSLAEGSPRPVRVVSVGCGPAYEIEVLLTRWPNLGPKLEIILIDQDKEAIACCERLLPLAAKTGAKVTLMRESIRRIIAAKDDVLQRLGSCDLIYSAGLFDYLSDRSFVALTSALYSALVPGGSLMIGNVSISNPSRLAMEYFSGWFLHHRSRFDLYGFRTVLSPPPESVEVGAEPLGVNLFLYVTAPR